MSWHKPQFQTYLIVVPALLAAGYSDIFSRIFTLRFSHRFPCQWPADFVYIQRKIVYLYSLTQTNQGKWECVEKMRRIDRLIPYVPRGQLTLKLWVTKQGSHPGSIIWIICLRADTGYQTLKQKKHEFTTHTPHTEYALQYCTSTYIYINLLAVFDQQNFRTQRFFEQLYQSKSHGQYKYSYIFLFKTERLTHCQTFLIHLHHTQFVNKNYMYEINYWHQYTIDAVQNFTFLKRIIEIGRKHFKLLL